MPYLKLSTSPPLSIFYLDQGPPSAPPILLIHGATCDLHDWSWQVPLLLSLGFRVITPDLRGHGKSSAPFPTPLSIEKWPGRDALSRGIIDYYPQSMAVDNISLLDHLGIERVIVMGHSLGSTVGYYMASGWRERVRACVAVDPYHNQPGEMRDLFLGGFDKDGGRAMLGWFRGYCYLGMEGNPPPEWQLAWHGGRTLGVEDEVMRGIAWGGWEARDSLGRMEVARGRFVDGEMAVRCPLLAVGAVEGNLVLEREIVGRKGDGRDEVRIVEGGGHWFHQVARGEEFNGILEGWLGKCGFVADGGSETVGREVDDLDLGVDRVTC